MIVLLFVRVKMFCEKHYQFSGVCYKITCFWAMSSYFLEKTTFFVDFFEKAS